MIERLTVIHRKGVPLELPAGEKQGWVLWSTCLRQIALGFAPLQAVDFLLPEDQMMQGPEAYEFLLQVVCGLHSPVSGETEVMGQFKTLANLWTSKKGSQGADFKKLFQLILADAKVVREKCLKGLGSQSYGSLARKYLKEKGTTAILGAGALSQEIIPWLNKGKRDIHVICRDPAKVSLPIEVHSFEDDLSSAQIEALVIAAPMTSRDICQWIEKSQTKPEVILDLRGTSTADPIENGISIIKLDNIFGELNENRSLIEEKIKQAFVLVSLLTRARVDAGEVRPFGWEDLCG